MRCLLLVLAVAVFAGCVDSSEGLDGSGSTVSESVPVGWDGTVVSMDGTQDLVVRMQPGRSGGAFLAEVEPGAWSVSREAVQSLRLEFNVTGMEGVGSSILLLDVSDGDARFLGVQHGRGDFEWTQWVADSVCGPYPLRMMVVWTANATVPGASMTMWFDEAEGEQDVIAYGDPNVAAEVATYEYTSRRDDVYNVEVRDERVLTQTVPSPWGPYPVLSGGHLEVEANLEGPGLYFAYAWSSGGTFFASGEWRMDVHADGDKRSFEASTFVPTHMEEVILFGSAESSVDAVLRVEPTTDPRTFWLFYASLLSIDPALLEHARLPSDWVPIDRALLYAPETPDRLVTNCLPLGA